jgi:hypothetical protein
MDLARMLEKCHREQWQVGDLDWTIRPKDMSREQEMAIVQYFTDMSGIERLAGALFREQRLRAKDPTLAQIFSTFEKDEIRHSHVAQMLADHYDVHKYKEYNPNPHMLRFRPHFVDAIRYLSPEIANVYITTGELILDIALLRSLDAYVDDEMSSRAMELVNRDESRHIAVDFHMSEYYSSPEHLRDLGARPPEPLSRQIKGWAALCRMLWFARPFFRDVFFLPMELTDPSGKRIREAFKRIQLLGAKPAVRSRPFARFLLGAQSLFNHPIGGILFGRIVMRILGCDEQVLRRLYNEDERKRAERMSFDEMADEALAQKFA